MEPWKPRRSGDDEALTDEERAVAERLDGETSLQGVADALGMELVPLCMVVARLVGRGVVEPEEEAPAEEGEEEAEGRNHRAIYERELRPLPRDARVALAVRGAGAELLALCFDPEPQVVAAVLANATSGLDHARLVAAHHKNPVGLEMLVQRAELARDPQVQRMLLRNDQLPDALLKRLLAGKPLTAIYKVALDRDVPERTRVQSRPLFRQRFAGGGSEEKAGLIMQTEGRVLTLLVGETLDARTTAILCGRSTASTALIQNLARFPACPPALLAHLARLPSVRRQPQLRQLLLQHPNMPGEVKRRPP